MFRNYEHTLISRRSSAGGQRSIATFLSLAASYGRYSRHDYSIITLLIVGCIVIIPVTFVMSDVQTNEGSDKRGSTVAWKDLAEKRNGYYAHVTGYWTMLSERSGSEKRAIDFLEKISYLNDDAAGWEVVVVTKEQDQSSAGKGT